MYSVARHATGYGITIERIQKRVTRMLLGMVKRFVRRDSICWIYCHWNIGLELYKILRGIDI